MDTRVTLYLYRIYLRVPSLLVVGEGEMVQSMQMGYTFLATTTCRMARYRRNSDQLGGHSKSSSLESGCS
ncbi:MAG: hypothetical protein QOI57_2893 [Rubrobacteraceae bacterium]|nr:hypothetical protein [Rubrobacteraceae bacterium]